MVRFIELPQEIIQRTAEATVKSDCDILPRTSSASLFTVQVQAVQATERTSGPHPSHRKLKGDLASLSIVSKELRAIVAPLLFERIRFPNSLVDILIGRDADPAMYSINTDFLANMHLTKLARILRVPHIRGMSALSNSRIFVPRILEVMQICSHLHTLKDIHGFFVGDSALVDAINSHPAIQKVWITHPEHMRFPETSPSASAVPQANVLRKLKCAYNPELSPREFHETFETLRLMLLHGMQVDPLILSTRLASRYLLSPSLPQVQALVVHRCDQVTDIVRQLGDVLVAQRSPALVGLELLDMPQTTFRLVHSGHVTPPILSTFEMGGPRDISVFSVTSSENGVRKMVCRKLVLSLALVDGPASTNLSDILDEISSTLPDLKELSLRLPSNFRFPEVYDANWSIVTPTQDMDIVRSLHMFRELERLTLITADLSIPRIQAMALSLAQSVPRLEIARVEQMTNFGDQIMELCVIRKNSGVDVDVSYTDDIIAWQDKLKGNAERSA